MSQPTHSDATAESRADPNSAKDHPALPEQPSQLDRRDHQKTLLLSDVPEAAALMPEADATVALSPSSTATGAQSPKPQFPSLDLTPLSQRYELLAEAGHGSMGNVYKARDRETGETIALKLLKPEISSDQSMMERFKKELLFARKITHKNVCRVHEFNRIGGIAYTSMEFVEGESLRSVLNRFGGLPLRKALDLSLQMCSALQEAHAQGIVHRDLKPENVMVDTQGNVKIMDFGIARSMDAMTRLTGSMVGTPAYMAPEQVSGKPVDFRTDIYALGLILYEIFTGHPAFQAENAVAVALKQMREAPKAPHEIEPSIPFGIERAIMKCLQKDPANRFQTVAQLADSLRAPAAASGAAVIAPPASLPLPTAGAPNRTTNGTGFTPHPLYGASALSMPEPKRRSKSGWILLLILLAGGVYAAMRWNQVVQAEREYAPLTVSAAKYYYAQAKSFIKGAPQGSSQVTAQPSAEASDHSGSQSVTASENPASMSQTDAQTVLSDSKDSKPDLNPSVAPALSAKPAAPKPAAHEERKASATVEVAVDTGKKQSAVGASEAPSPGPTAGAPARQTSTAVAVSAAPKTNSSKQTNSAPAAVQRRADAAFGEGTLAVPPVNDRSPRYLWIGRFEMEDRAQERARKVEDFGLPVIVIPRHNGGRQFFVVLSGPFGPERVGSVMDWLKKQGFVGVRVLKNPLKNGRLVPGVEQDPED